MTTPDGPDDDGTTPPAEHDGDDESVVTPPTYPAYSTPPPEGLPDAEHS